MKIHVIPTGQVYVSRIVPYGAKNIIDKAKSVLFKKNWVWLPVISYLIEHPKGLILVDTGWDRSISPNGTFDRSVQAKSLGSRLLPLINMGLLPKGEAIDEQLAKLGIKTSELDCVVLTHLDCDHACGLHHVADAKNILVSADELKFANKKSLVNSIRYQDVWWKDVPVKTFEWNGCEGPFKKSYDLLGDGTIELINIPGHSDGLVAVKISNGDKYVLLDGDGAYGKFSWEKMILPGISENPKEQLRSLEWIRKMSESENCIASFATHDPEIKPQVIEF